MLINIKRSLSQLYQTPKTHFSQNTLSLVTFFTGPLSYEYCKVFKNSYFYNTSRSSHLQMFFKIGVLKSFPNFTGKHLCWSFFLKSLQAEGKQPYRKTSPTQVFSCEVCKIFKSTFFYRIPLVTAFAVTVASSVFFLKINSYYYFATWL